MGGLANRANVARFLEKIRAPVLGLYPTAGPLTTPEQEQMLVNSIRDLRMVDMPAAYHKIQLLFPAGCANHLLRFMRSMMASPAATGDSVCDYFFSVSGVGVGVVLGPGTAGDVLSPGRTGAGVIVSGFVVGVAAHSCRGYSRTTTKRSKRCKCRWQGGSWLLLEFIRWW